MPGSRLQADASAQGDSVLQKRLNWAAGNITIGTGRIVAAAKACAQKPDDCMLQQKLLRAGQATGGLALHCKELS